MIPRIFPPGIVPTSGIVSGLWTQNYPGPDFRPVLPASRFKPATIDARTLTTNYNVLDNKSYGKELWLRGGFRINAFDNNATLQEAKSMPTARGAIGTTTRSTRSTIRGRQIPPPPHSVARTSVGSTVSASPSIMTRKLMGNITDLSWKGAGIAGMENRVGRDTFGGTGTRFNVAQDTVFGSPPDNVDLINPDRGFYLDEKG